MELKYLDQTKVILPYVNEEVKRFLTYDDKSVGVMISRLRQNIRYKKADPESYHARLAALKEEQKVCLVKYTVEGVAYTYSGLVDDLCTRFGWTKPVHSDFDTDQSRLIPTIKDMLNPRYYQKEAFDALVKVGFGGVELPTGAGKSLLLLMLLKHYGTKSLIVTPSSSITDQLYKDVLSLFGPKFVGKYGDGKKEYNKLFTIATSKSITLLKQGTPEYEAISSSKMVIADESHTIPAETFQKVCLEVCKTATLRFFVSATQTRVDGSEMLLKGITGPIVYRKSFADLSSEGYLKELTFHFFNVNSTGTIQRDPKRETRNQIFGNPNVNRLAGEIATRMVLSGRQTVILIEEYEQFLMLKNFLGVNYEFLHGTVTKEVKDKLPEEYWKCDIEKSVKDFNDGNLRCIIGTSSISTGIDLRPVGCIIYLQGGTSIIKYLQCIGRGTRPVAHKDLWVVDFRVRGSPIMERHASARAGLADGLGGKVLTHGWIRE